MKFDYLRQIYLSDTDAAGVLYFARGLEICHQAYEESLTRQEINLNEMIQEGKSALPITHASIDFLHPLFCGDWIEIGLTASLVNNSEFAITYQIALVENLTQISFQAKTHHVCINPQLRQRIDLPDSIMKWLAA